MSQPIPSGAYRLLFLFLFMVTASRTMAQGKIDWGRDTISRADATAGKLNYLNNIRGGGNPNATEQINLPVDKLKEIMDACAANNIDNISVFFIKIRQGDVAHYRQNNPAASDADLKGSQMLVFKIPRRAFGGQAGAGKIIPSSHPLMLSLAAAGLVQLNGRYPGLPYGTGDVYLTLGTICPPPASCGD